MGGQQTKSNHSPDKFTEVERSELKHLFSRLQSSDQQQPSQLDCISKHAFQIHCEARLDDWLIQRILNVLVVRIKGDDYIPWQPFLKLVSTVLRGDVDEKVEVIMKIIINNVQSSNTISGSSLVEYSRHLVTSCEKCYKGTEPGKSLIRCLPKKSTPDSLAYYLLHDTFYPSGPPKDLITRNVNLILSSKQFTLDELITGLGKSLLFQNISNSVFSRCFELNPDINVAKDDLIPRCLKVQSALISSEFTILDLSKVIFLNSLLPSEMKSQWRFLFSSASHGESFSKFLANIEQKGSTILIIRDNHGLIFGGFAPSSWRLGPKFFGTPQSFLFHLYPHFVPYPITGYNDNYQYLNIQQKTMPNGLGMGGTLEYFGLWIDSDFGKGICSPSCTTFACPQLSTEKEFTISHLEVWGVGPEPMKEEGLREPQSVLDKDPELKALMEVIGKKTNASDGYRERSDTPD